MRPRIAIPLPHSTDREYSERAIPQYERALEVAGGKAVRIPVDQPPLSVMQLIQNCDGVLLPGSKADVDPEKFGAPRSANTAAADPGRESIDRLLLEDAYASRKPVFGICYGLQSLNVFRSGSLVQHIPDFLPETLRGKVNHEGGKSVQAAHTVQIESGSNLAEILGRGNGTPAGESIPIPVNSSHHQAADRAGNGLEVAARCTEDGVIEALEGTGEHHFVIAVQWHPERSIDDDDWSRALFKAFVEAARRYHGDCAH